VIEHLLTPLDGLASRGNFCNFAKAAILSSYELFWSKKAFFNAALFADYFLTVLSLLFSLAIIDFLVIKIPIS
jgi:hypothetical protein